MRTWIRWVTIGAGLLGLSPGTIQADDAQLALQLANPVASLISVPFQNNWDFGSGDGHDGWRWTLNVQPVIPFSVAPEWNVISRTILPIIHQDDVVPGTGTQSGLGDTVQSFFLSPKKPGPFGLIWGVGPVMLLPTATDDFLGAERWGAGPTGVALQQHGPWTFGALMNHLWSFAGNDRRAEVSATFLQPFINYTTPRATSFVVNTESTYDWVSSQWVIPFNAGVLQVFKIGGQRIQIGLMGRWYAESPDGGPEWGFRVPITFLFPR